MFKEFDEVLVARLRHATRDVEGTDALRRQPLVGDSGTVVHVLDPEHYIVECVQELGGTIWLADFHVGELVSATVLNGWRFTTTETSLGAYRATGADPTGVRVDCTDNDPEKALAFCRAFALEHLRT